jgi:DNA-binding LacI/PurR family transcriptional regulator
MGANACRLLLDRIKKRNAPLSRVVLPVELRVRDSTSKPPQAAAAAKKKPAKK